MFERYIPDPLFGDFCEFAGITEIRKSPYSTEVYRGIWKEAIVIFSRLREGWLEVNCCRPSFSEEFDGILKKFHSFLEPEKKE